MYHILYKTTRFFFPLCYKTTSAISVSLSVFLQLNTKSRHWEHRTKDFAMSFFQFHIQTFFRPLTADKLCSVFYSVDVYTHTLRMKNATYCKTNFSVVKTGSASQFYEQRKKSIHTFYLIVPDQRFMRYSFAEVVCFSKPNEILEGILSSTKFRPEKLKNTN